MKKSIKDSTDARLPNLEKKPGFVGRLFKKLDGSLKEKADQQSQKDKSCCSPNGKDGKCC